MHAKIAIRPGSEADKSLLIELMDEAVAWMVDRGQTGQWGDKPVAERVDGERWISGLASDSGLRIVELDHVPAGALIVGDAPEYVPEVAERDMFINMLVTCRRLAGNDLGSALVTAAIEEGLAGEREVLRVDCWADAPTLVRWYERQGFERTGTFELDDGWKGQLFSMPLRHPV
jgi:GNAT superfamily N-acetyltransferase